MNDAEAKIIANALYEIRLLLSSYIGSGNAAPADVRFAAQLAYALHNEALALAQGTGFDMNTALEKVAAIDGILNTQDSSRLVRSWAALIIDST